MKSSAQPRGKDKTHQQKPIDIAKAFYDAIQAGNIKEVERLLKAGVSPNQALANGFMPLFAAAKRGHPELVALLLENGAAIDQTSNEGATPLYVAAQKGHTEVAELLLKMGAAIDQANVNGFTPLHVATHQGHTKVAALLLEKRAAIDQANVDGITPLHIAVLNGQTELVALLLEKGAAINQANNNGCSAFYIAAQNGYTKLAALLLEKRAAIDLANNDGFTPLHIAAYKGQTEFVELLLEMGAAIDQANNDGFTPLHLAAEKGHTELAALLLKMGAAIDQADNDGFTPLHIAAQNGYANIASAIILKSKKNDRQSQGFLSSRRKTFAFPYIDRENQQEETALDVAINNGHLDAASVLIAAKADINYPDREGNTPLMRAVLKNEPGIVALLLQAGAGWWIRNEAHQYALGLALAASPPHSLIIDLLLAGMGKKVAKSRSTQKIETSLLAEQAGTLLMADQSDDKQQAEAWKEFVKTLCIELDLRHIVAEGLVASLRQMPPLWPGPGGKLVKPTAAQVRQFIWHMLDSAQRLYELSNEKDPNRVAYYAAPHALPEAAKLIDFAADQSRQVIADAEAALRNWVGELGILLTSLTPATSADEIQLKLQQEIGLHSLLAEGIATLWTTLKKPQSAAGLLQAMQKQFNMPKFLNTVTDAGSSDALRFMLSEQLRALIKLVASAKN